MGFTEQPSRITYVPAPSVRALPGGGIMTNAEIFRLAADYIREHGLLKGQFGDDGGPRCLEGALESACGLQPLPGLVRVANIPVGVFEPIKARFNWPESTIEPFRWNDAPERTAAEVIALFDGLAFDEDLKAAAQSPLPAETGKALATNRQEVTVG